MRWTVLAAAMLVATPVLADRWKADLLLVVAHPDDETLVASYLARAVIDEHRRVAVVYCTRGEAGDNAAGRERAGALAAVREQEARRALATLGIGDVWFLDGRDTASQDVLRSLGSWPHGAVLESLVRIVRLTRPEVVLTWLPSSVAGENHGDHQAAGVLATEAFDLAGSTVAFPAQLAAPARTFESALEGLETWQPKKLYFFTDAFDAGFIDGHGPAYAIRDVSPSRKVPYVHLALREFAPHLSQSPDPAMNEAIAAGQRLDEIAGMATAGDEPFLPEKVRLLRGKSHVKSSPAADVFDGVGSASLAFAPPRAAAAPTRARLELGGAWGYYRQLWRAHDLDALAVRPDEIAVRPGDTLVLPLIITSAQAEVALAVTLPPGWREKEPGRHVTVTPNLPTRVGLAIIAPDEERKKFETIRVAAGALGGVSLAVQVRRSVLPQ